MNPIGVFDSGIGGLTVLREIRKVLPHENLTYFADAAHLPYGNKPDVYIRDRGMHAVTFLVEQGAKAIVVACNTATALSVAELRSQFKMPVIAIEPAVKPALEQTRSGKIGVLATQGTLQSQRFANLVARFANNKEVITQPCPGLVEQIEKGELSGSVTQALIEQYTRALIQKGVDVIVLGCTHYPFVRSLIEKAAGKNVTVIDSGLPVAKQLARQLTLQRLTAPASNTSHERFWTSGPEAQMQLLLDLLWLKKTVVNRVPEQHR